MALKNLILLTLTIGVVTAELALPNWISRNRRELVDLHNGEFCVDVSTFGPIDYQPEPRETCDTEFVKQCEEKNEQVCDEVTEIECDVIPFTDCKMTMEMTPYKSFESVPKIFKKTICNEGIDTVQHTKMMPECRNVTKQNCITKWETDENGKQVWAGNEECEPVTWRECKLIPRQVDFKVPKVECDEGEDVEYEDIVEAQKEAMTTKMTCEIKHTTDCKPVTSTKCNEITYTECFEVPQEECTQKDVLIPTQEKDHRKKCLLPGDSVPSKAANNGIQGRDSNAKAQPAPTLQASESRAESVQQPKTNYLSPAAAKGTPRGGRRLQQQRLQQQRRFQQQQFQQQQTLQAQASAPVDQRVPQPQPQAVRQSRTFTGQVSAPVFQPPQNQQFSRRFGPQQGFTGSFVRHN